VIKTLLSLLLLFSFAAHAQMDLCNAELQEQPVQAGGRVKPLYVLANETIRFITGDSKVNDLSATQAFCKLTLKAFGMPLNLPLKVKVDHIEARKFLGMEENSTSIAVDTLFNKVGLIETELAQLKENNSYKKELNRVNQRLRSYAAIVEARAWTVPIKKADKIEFIPIAQYITEERMQEAKGKSDNPVKHVLDQAKNTYLEVEGDDYLLELTYYKLNLFVWAMLVSILAMLFLVALKNKTLGIILTAISIMMQIAGMTMRVLISGRAPVTNMYETVMFSGFGALIIAGIITIYRKEITFLLAGLAFNVLSLMMMKFAHGMLDEGISPLVPVLRDNFWLSTHVTTIILSYAALALSWILANSLLIRSRFFKVEGPEYRYQVDLIYTCIKFGVVLLAAGVILGGVWADYSWGRFWGWDPKETWSLIVLLVYMAILHGKYTSWIPPHRFVTLVAGAFMSVMMAWFGVNYILASGLHSYGFSEGGAIFLGSFFALQIAILLVGAIKKRA
jgi:cytochrome c-type biogenesis protein CcsB